MMMGTRRGAPCASTYHGTCVPGVGVEGAANFEGLRPGAGASLVHPATPPLARGESPPPPPFSRLDAWPLVALVLRPLGAILARPQPRKRTPSDANVPEVTICRDLRFPLLSFLPFRTPLRLPRHTRLRFSRRPRRLGLS